MELQAEEKSSPSSSNSYPELSIVVPLYNEQDSLSELSSRIVDAIAGAYSYEIIFVDDGSSDDSWNVIEGLAEKYDYVRGIKFHRNYGKSTALQCGFEECRGTYVVTMDADLQDDPEEIPGLVEMLKEGYELISGWKKKRYDPISKTIPSRFFNWVTSLATGIPLHDFNCGLKAYHYKVVKRIQLYGELHRYVPLLANWEGFTYIGEKEVKHHPRKYGKTKFGLSRFAKGFLDLLTILFINNYLQRPMHFFGGLGLLFILAGGLVNAYLAVLKLFYNEALSNRPLLLLGILLLVMGAQFFSVGFLGELMTKNRQSIRKPNIQHSIRSTVHHEPEKPGEKEK